jgi:sugar/nucleoside kinase (ribokinase family)
LPADCLAVEAGQKTGYCLTILDGKGERTFLTFNGHEKDFSADILPATVTAGTTFVYVTGYYLLNNESTARVLEELQRFNNSGCPILFDPGPLVGNIDPRQLTEMISLATVMTPNEHELVEIMKTLGITGDPVKHLLGMGVQHTVVKNGEHGVKVHSTDSAFTQEGFKVKVADSTGAGDSFAGGLIHALMQRMSLREAVEFASACGAYSTTITGPHGFFTKKDILEFISIHKEAKK